MKRIRLYQIPFSHYCDKIRWTLDYFHLDFTPINYSQSNLKEFRSIPKEIRRLFPLIEDENVEGKRFVSDSTPILIYLNDFYSTKENFLLPSNENENERKEIIEYCLMLDSELGLYSRRLAYLYLINECPSIISVLIDGNYSNDLNDSSRSRFHRSLNWLKKKINGYFASMIIIERFRLDQILNENLDEKTKKLLNRIENDLKMKKYLFQNRFSAADLTLSSLIYPLKLIESIRIEYSSLFDHLEQIRNEFDRKSTQMKFIENSLEKHRQKSSSSNKFVRQSMNFISFYFFSFVYLPFKPILHRIQSNQLEFPSTSTSTSTNDQRILRLNSKLSLMKMFFINSFHYFVSIPKQVDQIERRRRRRDVED